MTQQKPLITTHRSYRSHRPLQAGLQKCNPCCKGGDSEIKEFKELKAINEADLILNIFNFVKLLKFFIRIAQPKRIFNFSFLMFNFA